jgi:Uma2 family endonuclease
MMTATLIEQQNNKATSDKKAKGISWPEFQKKYLNREDGNKYEWVNREVVKSKHMDYTQFFIVNNLLEFFEHLKTLGKVSGILMPEGDMHFAGNHRRPDLAFLTKKQLALTSYGENQVPLFVIEVISTKDQMNLVHEKMEDYRNADVKVVWHIFPKINQVHVYSGHGLKKMNVCKGFDVCSASEVIPDFELTVDAILFKQPKPE